jgi:hypothetical protein
MFNVWCMWANFNNMVFPFMTIYCIHAWILTFAILTFVNQIETRWRWNKYFIKLCFEIVLPKNINVRGKNKLSDNRLLLETITIKQ